MQKSHRALFWLSVRLFAISCNCGFRLLHPNVCSRLSTKEREEKLIKTKGSVLDRMMNATTTPGASSTSKAAAAIMRFGGITSDRYQDKLLDEQISEEDGLLSIVVAETILKWHAEAIGRCAELSPPNDM